jgi:TonB-like protein
MSTMRASIAMLLLVAGCGGTPAVSEPAAGPAPTPVVAAPPVVAGPLVVEPMVFQPPEGMAIEGRIEILEDGTIAYQGEAVATIAPDRIHSADGALLAQVASDGSVSGKFVEAGVRFDGDELVRGDGTRLAIDAAGEVRASRAGAPPVSIGRWSRVGSARRTAILVALLVMSPASRSEDLAYMPPPPEEGGEEGGMEGGVAGGEVGGVVGELENGPPPPPPPPQLVPPAVIEGQRIAGDREIPPDDEDKLVMVAARQEKATATLKLCVGSHGAAEKVELLRSSNLPRYDAKLLREMRLWRFRPFLINGKAVPVCTSVTFIFKLRLPPPPKPAAP